MLFNIDARCLLNEVVLDLSFVYLVPFLDRSVGMAFLILVYLLEEPLLGNLAVPFLLTDSQALELLHALVELDTLAHLLEEAFLGDAFAALLQAVRV